LGPDPDPVGSEVAVDLYISEASQVWSWTVMISWDPNVLQIIGVEEGPFLSTSSHSIQGTLFLGDDPLLWKTKNGVGFIESGITCTRVASTAGPRNEGLLATVRFEVVGAGTSLIDISESVVSDVTLMEAVATVNSATVDVLSPSSGPSVVFSPSGLASGTIWNVTCNGETKSSGGDITFQLAAGSYSYSVGSVKGYSASPSSGAVTVSSEDRIITVTFTSLDSGAHVDVLTDRGGVGFEVNSGSYGPQELIRMYGLVTYNSASVANVDVTFTVKDATGNIIALRLGRTNATGYAFAEYRLPWADTRNPESNFGTWSITASVAVSDFTVADTLKFSVNYLVNIANNGMQLPVIVNRQSTLNLMVTIDSIASPAVSSTLIVTVYDDAKVPLGSFVATGEYGAGNSTVPVAIKIPSWAFIGTATVYVNLLTTVPGSGGVSRCPEKIAHFQIVP
jgi:hypothetical protein